MTASPPATKAVDEGSLRYPGWRVVLACFLAAMLCWGFGLYGHGVYLTELHRLHGWPTSLISGAITCFYLLTATMVFFISDVIGKLGPKRAMFGGVCCFATAVALLPVINAPWQLFLVYALMAAGAASTHVGAISNVVGLWFDQKRALAISVALIGASSGGVLITPVLVLAISQFGFAQTITVSAALMAAVLLTAIALWIDRPPAQSDATAGRAAAAVWTRGTALRSFRFWSVAAPFTIALTAQVGFLVHQIAILQPAVGRQGAGFAVAGLTVASIAGRLGLGAFADRLNMRHFTACSLATQAVALLAMILSADTLVLFAACALYGLSAGNLVTLPALVIQREFDAASFGMMVGLTWAVIQFTYAFGPGILGALRDLTGSYGAPLAFCLALKIVAAVLILLKPRSDRAD